MNFQFIISKLKEGAMPALTGLYFTQQQADEIKDVLDSQKKNIDDYFNHCVATRIVRTHD